MFHGTSFTRWPITSVSPEKTVAAINSNPSKRMFTKAVLAKYVADDCASTKRSAPMWWSLL